MGKNGKGVILMGWVIIIIIGYIPVLYHMLRRIHNLEEQVRELSRK